YRVRLINAEIDIFFMFSIDNHTMEAIANDLVPIQPFNTSIVSIGIGQRYDVIIHADQSDTADNFWIRAVPQTSCSSTNSMEHVILGIVYYGTSPSTPDTTGYNKTDSCDDISSTDLVPYVSKTVDSAAIWAEEEPVTIGAAPTNSNLLWWSVNGATLDMSWLNP
ncbi:Cupredoxin, partial [Chaetomium strumarium]